MFDIAPSELALVGVVALVVIGPKDLPRAMRVVGYWVGRGRSVMRQVREGFDTMMREAELKELEEQWAKQNAAIMRETSAEPGAAPMLTDGDALPVMTAAPVLTGPPPPSHDEIEAAIGLAPAVPSADPKP